MSLVRRVSYFTKSFSCCFSFKLIYFLISAKPNTKATPKMNLDIFFNIWYDGRQSWKLIRLEIFRDFNITATAIEVF